MRPVSFVALACAATLALGCGKKSDDGAIKVAAAASLTGAFSAIGEAFTARTGEKVTFVFASSGKLAQQIENGAPFDVFAAADMSYIDRVIGAGAADAASKRSYARGRVVVWVGDEAATISTLTDLESDRFEKIALADPDAAPYGRAAREALQKAGVWPAIDQRKVYANNVRQAMQFAQTGNADAALIALSLALPADGHYIMVDESLHAPLEQGIAVVADSKKKTTGQKFIDFVDSEEGHAILSRFGLLQPGQ